MQSVDVAENDRTQPGMDGFYPSSDRQFRKDGSRSEHRYWKAINWTLLGATLGSCERFNSLTRDEYYLVEILWNFLESVDVIDFWREILA